MNEQRSKLEILKKKKEQLNARIHKIESMEKVRERKRDTRRKILIGAYRVGGVLRTPSSHTTVHAMSHTAVSVKLLATAPISLLSK